MLGPVTFLFVHYILDDSVIELNREEHPSPNGQTNKGGRGLPCHYIPMNHKLIPPPLKAKYLTKQLKKTHSSMVLYQQKTKL